MSENKNNQELLSLISLNTKAEAFVKKVDEILTPEERQGLGEGAAEKVVTSLSYLGVYDPGDFGKGAFTFTCSGELNEGEADIAWTFLRRTGILKEKPALFGEERAGFSQETKQMLINPSNGFLTDD